MEIFFEGIHLRPWLFDDTEQLAKIANSKKIADNLRDGNEELTQRHTEKYRGSQSKKRQIEAQRRSRFGGKTKVKR
jgi:hypothetical protein